VLILGADTVAPPNPPERADENNGEEYTDRVGCAAKVCMHATIVPDQRSQILGVLLGIVRCVLVGVQLMPEHHN
jgi:hypothetical protein